jgi:hypothetical protein
MRAPSGSLRFGTTQHVKGSARDLSSLATDLARIKLMDRRVLTAEWVDRGPAVGGVALVAVSVTFSHAWVHRAIGSQQANVRLIQLEPARRVGYVAESSRGEAFLLMTFKDVESGCEVQMSGWIAARDRRTRRALRLLQPVAVSLATRSLRRTLVRASLFLREDQAGI